MSIESIYLKKSNQRLKHGHLWIFSNELKEIPKIEPGSIVEVFDKSTSLGYAYYNPNSLISIRLLNTNSEINEDFYRERINAAYQLRQQILPHSDNYRLVYGESDGLPGLIIDRFSDYLSLQTLSAGADKHLEWIISAILNVLPETKGIAIKNRSHLRKLEGMPEYEKIAYGDVPEYIQINENGIKHYISIVNAQKTGYFLDQKLNRLAVQQISSGLEVLDLFANQGGFALNALKGGARKAVAVDSSDYALELAQKTAKANNINNLEYVSSDVFDYLNNSAGQKFDLIIVDPPAFAKNKKSVSTARVAYRKVNHLAIKHLKSKGLLATSSCSQHIEESVFELEVTKAAMKAGKNLRLLWRGQQSPDHHILTAMPETKYLKFFVFQVF